MEVPRSPSHLQLPTREHCERQRKRRRRGETQPRDVTRRINRRGLQRCQRPPPNAKVVNIDIAATWRRINARRILADGCVVGGVDVPDRGDTRAVRLNSAMPVSYTHLDVYKRQRVA